jgi:hypothetical protein
VRPAQAGRGTMALWRTCQCLQSLGCRYIIDGGPRRVQLSTVCVENCTRRAPAVERCTRRASGRTRRVHFSTPPGPGPEIPARRTGSNEPPRRTGSKATPARPAQKAWTAKGSARSDTRWHPAPISAPAGLKPAAHPAHQEPTSCRNTCSRPGWRSPPPVCAAGQGA